MEELDLLKNYLKKLGSVAIAFSGGVDSTFLAWAAHEALGENAVAVTVSSCFVPMRELEQAKNFCRENKIRQIILEMNPLEIEGVALNPKNRCYLCKKKIFENIKQTALTEGFSFVADGTNVDDTGDFRPGLAALCELEIKSPLRECGFSKAEIREASKNAGLETWNNPSFACLASRFVYGEEITNAKLAAVEKAEDFLLSKGFSQIRVRVHKNLARIEVLPKQMEKLFAMRNEVDLKLKEIGFDFVTMDLHGFKSGSMNV